MLSDTQIETALLDQLTGLSNRMGMEAYLKELPEDIADIRLLSSPRLAIFLVFRAATS